jgi:predicted kinase
MQLHGGLLGGCEAEAYRAEGGGRREEMASEAGRCDAAAVNGLIVSGPPGSGKTTLARALAAGVDRSVHLQTDQFFAAIARGFVQPWLAAAAGQNETAVRAIAAAAVEYMRGGYFVVVDGVVLPWALAIYRERCGDAGLALGLVVLLPGEDETARRGLARPEDHGLTDDVYRTMHSQFARAGFAAGEVIDSTGMEVGELVQEVGRRGLLPGQA